MNLLFCILFLFEFCGARLCAQERYLAKQNKALTRAVDKLKAQNEKLQLKEGNAKRENAILERKLEDALKVGNYLKKNNNRFIRHRRRLNKTKEESKSFWKKTKSCGSNETSWSRKKEDSATNTSTRLTLAGIIFFAPLRGYRPQKWSPGESALLTDWLIRDLQIWVKQNEKRLASLVDILKCPKNVHLFRKMSIKKSKKIKFFVQIFFVFFFFV